MGKERNQMTETTEILIRVMEQQLLQAKQSEDQRSNITSIIVLIAAAIQGVLTQTGFTKNSLPLTITLIVIGIFGVVATAKLYERFRYHYEVMRQIRKKLEELNPDATIRACMDAAWQEHIKNHTLIPTRIRLYMVWLTLHILIAALGVIYTLIILTK
jgi:hypothetical protein